jgi:hypothetical protein
LHRHQRVSGPDSPAPVGINGRGIGDSLQFAQCMRATQLMLSIEVDVLACSSTSGPGKIARLIMGEALG